MATRRSARVANRRNYRQNRLYSFHQATEALHQAKNQKRLAVLESVAEGPKEVEEHPEGEDSEPEKEDEASSIEE